MANPKPTGTTRASIGPAERAAFEARGWLVLRAVLPGAELAAVRAAFDAVHEAYPAHVQDVVGREVWQLFGAARLDDHLRAAVLHGIVGPVARTTLGCEAVQLFQDVGMTKTAGVGGTIHWHQDHAYQPFVQPPRMVSVRVALDPETEASGGMVVLDGSHQWDAELSMDRNWYIDGGALERLPAELRARVPEVRTAVPMEPGDVSVHHCRLWHASTPNESVRDRRTLVAHVLDAACVADPATAVPTGPDGTLDPEHFPLL